MLTLERQNQIVELLKKKSPLSVKELSKKLFVSEATIRRDLNDMEEQLLIRRMHGGAVLAIKDKDELGISFRLKENVREKQKIALLALPFISKAKSIFMDASSTSAILASVVDTNYSTIVTTGIESALYLSKKNNNNVILVGGTVAYGTNSISGPITIKQLCEFNFDIALMSCSGIDSDFCASEKTIEQSHIKQQILNRAKFKILLVDSSKFGVSNFSKITSIKEFNCVITDKKPSDEFIKYTEEHRIKLLYK